MMRHLTTKDPVFTPLHYEDIDVLGAATFVNAHRAADVREGTHGLKKYNHPPAIYSPANIVLYCTVVVLLQSGIDSTILREKTHYLWGP